MSFPAGNLIQINARISPTGLGTANFASAMVFAPKTDVKAGFNEDTYREYFSLKSLAVDVTAGSETYNAAAKWLGGIPATRSVRVYVRAAADTTWPQTLNKAFDKTWWYWTFVTKTVYAAVSDVLAIAEWCEQNGIMFVNNQTGAAATTIRDPNAASSVAAQLTTLGYRHVFTPCHATDAYAGNALAKHFAAVNYSATNSTITGEFKKSPGVAAEDLTDTAYSAMMAAKTKATFYTVVDNQGSVDVGRWLNTMTHSTYGEEIANVVDLDACINYLQTALYNVVANQPTKLRQTPQGQAMLIGTARNILEGFIRNGYLGPRNYLDPDDGIEKYTVGYEILTKPEDILNLSQADRDAHKSAPLRIRLFRAGSIWTVQADIDVY
ncbi:MAG: DUF3383 family protein [Plesiomonas sp.]